MNAKTLLIFSLLVALAGSTGPLRAAAGDQSDSSDFDVFLNRLSGNIPFPPEELIRQLRPDEFHQIVATIIPHGRSLERHHTDFVYPRSVMVWQKDPLETDSQRVFIGYTPKMNQLEIISLNRTTNQNEFRIVRNYGPGMTPSIERADEATCRTCHQGGGLIFPVSPWSETEEHPITANKLENTPGLEPFASFLLKNEDRKLVNRTAVVFDRSVREANQFHMARSMCSNACENDSTCRANIVGISIFQLLLGREFDFNKRKPFLDFFKKRKIPGREAVKVKHDSDQKLPRTSVIPDRKIDFTPQFTQEDFDRKMVGRQDPIFPRDIEESRPDWFDMGACIGQWPSNYREELHKESPDDLMAFLDSPPLRKLVSESWIPEPAQIMFAYSQYRTNKKASVKQCANCTDHNRTTEPLDTKSKEAINHLLNHVEKESNKGPEAKDLFAIYCYSCHYHTAHNTPPALPFDDPIKLSTYVGDGNRTVKGLLEKKIMPPPDRPQPTTKELEFMLRTLEQSIPKHHQ